MEVVITRRFFSFFLAGVVATSTIIPASAWTRDSFVAGGEEYEDTVVASQSVYSAPRKARMVQVSSEVQEAVEASSSAKLVVPSTLPSTVNGPTQVLSKLYEYSKLSGPSISTTVTSSDRWTEVAFTGAYNPQFVNGLSSVWYYSFSYAPDVSDDTNKIRGLAALCAEDSAIFPSWYINVNGTYSGGDLTEFTVTNSYDVSSFSSSAFSLDGVDSFVLFANGPYWPSWTGFSKPTAVDVLVDGQQVLTLVRGTSSYIDFGGYVFSGSANISTISFRWHIPFLFFVSDDVSYAGDYSFLLRSDILGISSLALTISFLDGQDVINAQNDKTKDDINKHEEYESQWTGSMIENFNALGFSDFSWSDSLVSGFSLFSGIFMDIWRALGGATILFTFPLLLGVALLLVGRISRSGGRSGSGKGGGDGG